LQLFGALKKQKDCCGINEIKLEHILKAFPKARKDLDNLKRIAEKPEIKNFASNYISALDNFFYRTGVVSQMAINKIYIYDKTALYAVITANNKRITVENIGNSGTAEKQDKKISIDCKDYKGLIECVINKPCKEGKR